MMCDEKFKIKFAISTAEFMFGTAYQQCVFTGNNLENYVIERTD